MSVQIFDQLKTILPELSKLELSDLEESIKTNGQLIPIATCIIEGTNEMFILDGHNRFEITKKLGIEPKFCDHPISFKTKEEAMIWIISNQLGRRNLPKYWRCALVLKKKDFLNKIGRGIQGQTAVKREEPDWLKKPLVSSGKLLPPLILKSKAKSQSANKEKDDVCSDLNKRQSHDTKKILADEAGVSVGTFHKIAKIEKEGSEDLKRRCLAEEITPDAAYKELRGVNSDDPPLSNIDKIIAKTYELANKILARNDDLDLDQRDQIFDVVEVLNECVHEPEEQIPNMPSFGDELGDE